jgi:hypothetical protein
MGLGGGTAFDSWRQTWICPSLMYGLRGMRLAMVSLVEVDEAEKCCRRSSPPGLEVNWKHLKEGQETDLGFGSYRVRVADGSDVISQLE